MLLFRIYPCGKFVIFRKTAVAGGRYHPPEQHRRSYSEKLTRISTSNVYDLNLATAEQLELLTE
jgi:hypothetical protein